MRTGNVPCKSRKALNYKRKDVFGASQDHPPTPNDFGGTNDNPQPPTANQVLVVFTWRARIIAKESAYAIRLGNNSHASVGKNGTCLENSEVPLSASIRLKRD